MMSATAIEIVGNVIQDHAVYLANRIAENREIAGLHYKSDTDQGVNAANEAMKRLRQSKQYQAAVLDAQDEWRA
jgi:hypothetical protein